jgi:hypothetical protein
MGAADGPTSAAPLGVTLPHPGQDLLFLSNVAAETGNTPLAQSLLTDWFDLWWLGMLRDHQRASPFTTSNPAAGPGPGHPGGAGDPPPVGPAVAPAVVPEPGSFVLATLGALGLAGYARRRPAARPAPVA